MGTYSHFRSISITILHVYWCLWCLFVFIVFEYEYTVKRYFLVMKPSLLNNHNISEFGLLQRPPMQWASKGHCVYGFIEWSTAGCMKEVCYWLFPTLVPWIRVAQHLWHYLQSWRCAVHKNNTELSDMKIRSQVLMVFGCHGVVSDRHSTAQEPPNCQVFHPCSAQRAFYCHKSCHLMQNVPHWWMLYSL